MSPATARSGRRSVTLWTAGALVILVVVAVTGLGGQVPALAFRQAGHWVYNSTVGAVFHVDGGSKSVDARMSLPGVSPENQVLQDDQHGYVVDRRNGRVLVFGKSDLSVDSTLSVGSGDEPVSLEVAGGPYLVYEHTGRIIRLGQRPVTVNSGGALQTPVATTSGTIWVQRKGGALCSLSPGGRTLKCPDSVPTGHRGALTTVDDHPAFVDLTAGSIQPVTKNGLGKSQPLGVPLPADAQISSADAGGRLPIISPDYQHQPALLLIDTSALALGKPAAKPIAVPLHNGKFDAPITSGGAIAVVNTTAHRVVTYTNDGAQKASVPVPAGSGSLQVSRGEDGRVYIDNAAGSETFVVDGNGSVTPVEVSKESGSGHKSTTAPPKNPPKLPPTAAKTPTPKKPVGPPPPVPTKASPRAPVHVPTQKHVPVRPTPRPSVRPTRKPPTQQPPPTQEAPPTLAPPTPTAHVPAAPPTVQATPSTGQAVVNWTTPADNGSPIRNYVVSLPGRTMTVPAGQLSITITGLTDGTRYVVSVAATNSVGTGPATSSPAFVPNPALAAPTGVTAHANSNGTATIQWHAQTRTLHGPVRFIVTAGGRRIAETSAMQATATGLTAGQTYRFTVEATDGTSTASATSAAVIAFAAPSAPGGLNATPGHQSIALSWGAAPLNGGKLVGYVVSGGGADRTVTTTSATINGLTAGNTYTFSVHVVTADPNGGAAKLTGPAVSKAVHLITVPTVTIHRAWIDDDDTLHVDVTVDDGGSATTCYLVVLITINKGVCSGPMEITQDEVNVDSDVKLPISVYGTNSAGRGPAASTSVQGKDDDHSGDVQQPTGVLRRRGAYL